jgi:hypothetical protein
LKDEEEEKSPKEGETTKKESQEEGRKKEGQSRDHFKPVQEQEKKTKTKIILQSQRTMKEKKEKIWDW